ncbi:CehA/McbA family metallohydrolase [Persicitalea sp.]|uniref:CehA/McbA family metallohydrolase n=1 Tax=Persicitalea sp. TaxID=3100273 RepID=UPI003594031A
MGFGQPTGNLRIRTIDDENDKPTPVRVRLTQSGKPIPALPGEAVAVSYGLWDHADGYAFQPDSSFYIDGAFSLDLAPGNYQLTLSKGPEFLRQSHELTIEPGVSLQKTFRLKRWIDMAARHWYSADDHIHIRRSPSENEFLLNWIRAEDLNVGVMLKMGDFWATYYPQYAFGEQGVYQRGNHLLTSGQEDPRTPELGHALGFGADASVRFAQSYYYYDKVFDEIRRRGGLAGYAHQAESFHGYRGLTLDGLRGKVDVLEILQYCVSARPLRTEQYYRMLDLGFPLTAVAGSDFPWCGQDHEHGTPERTARIGNARFYTYLDEPFSASAWQKAVAAGRTFVSSGPMLDLRVNKARPGDRLDVKPGDSLTVTVHAYGQAEQVPLYALELIAHGQVLNRVTSNEPGQSAEHLSLIYPFEALQRGMWIAARCFGDSTQAAHTTPVYVTVNGSGFHNPKTTGKYLSQSEEYLRELEKELDTHRDNPEFRAWYYKQGLKSRIQETREVIANLRKRLAR